MYHTHVLRRSYGVLLRCEKDPRLPLGSSYVSGYWEMRSIAIDGGTAEIETSGTISRFTLCLMCPQVRDLTVGEDVSLSLTHAFTSLGMDSRASSARTTRK